jgi:glycyl-tRNA synthetase alpha chain
MGSFQKMCLTLQKFWSDKGCALLQPYDVSVGAATFHPEIVLKALSPDAWNVAFMQACRRPGDGRFGDNPNRLQKFHQFQVFLKPIPEQIKFWMMESFAAIGIDVEHADIRFVEDNWESPTLGAQGLGWEVWLNGMEVLQFTYFQKIGGFECHPASVELAYGMERLAMIQQNKNNIFDILWREAPFPLTYRDLFLEQEKMFSRYYFDYTQPDQLKKTFEHALENGERALNAGLILPAYELCVESSHTFNMLDASGTLGVSHRAHYIFKIRELARACCSAWIEKSTTT